MPQPAKKLISIKDLPKERIYIGVNNKLIKIIISKIKLRYSINSFRIKNKLSFALYLWIKRREFPFIELSKILRLLKIKGLNLEKNVLYIKTGRFPPKNKSSGNLSPPLYTKFPVYLSKELVRIIAHLFADGCVSVNKKGSITAAYYNKEKELRQQFNNDISKVFNISSLKEGINKEVPYLSIPSTISIILLQLAPSFKSNECRVPIFVKNATKDLKKEFIQAFFDDEASVHYRPPIRQIELTINNKEILNEIKELLLELNINTSNVIKRKMRGFKIFTFYIRNFDNINQFYKQISFSSTSKFKKLNQIMKNPGRKSYARGESERRILGILKNNDSTSSKIMGLLNRKRVTVNICLSKLEKRKLVFKKKIRKINKNNREIVWGLR